MEKKEIEANNGKINLDNPNDLLKEVGDQIGMNFNDGKSEIDKEIEDELIHVLKGTKLSNRIIFIRHGQTSLEGTDQPDDLEILPEEFNKIHELNNKILIAGLGSNNIYFLSNNRTTRIQQTADTIIKGLDLYYGRTDVSFLDTTNKQIKKNVRIAMINGLSSILTDQILDLLKGDQNVQIISVIHSSNQASIEGYLQPKPFTKNEKLGNLSSLILDINENGVIDYGINDGFQLTHDNIEEIIVDLTKLSTYGNSESIEEIIRYLNGDKYSIIDKQNILNYYLFTDLNLIENIILNGTSISLILKSLNLLVNRYSKFDNSNYTKYLENILKLIEIGNNQQIWELIDIFKDNKNLYKIIYQIESEIGINNEFIIYLNKTKETKHKELLRIIKKAKKSILGRKIMFGLFVSMFLLSIPCGYYVYDNYKFIQKFKNNPQNLAKLEFNDFTFKNLEIQGVLSLDLSGLKQLEQQQAYYLMQMNFQTLDLSGLESLTDETAQELSKFKGAILKLNGLKTISADQFEKVTSFCSKLGGVIQLNNIKDLDYETIIKVINFDGDEIQLKSLEFKYNLANFLLINSFIINNELVINNSRINLSNEYYIKTTEVATNKTIFDRYKNDMINEINQKINSNIYDLESFNKIFIHTNNINELQLLNFDFDENINEYIKDMIGYLQGLRDPYLPYLKKYIQDFFKIEILKFQYYNKDIIESNIGGFVKYFEDQFLNYLKGRIPQEEYETLIKKIYENNNVLNYETAKNNYNKRYMRQIVQSNEYNNEKGEDGDTIYFCGIDVNNDLLLGQLLNKLDKSNKYNLRFYNVENLSSIIDNLDNINIKNFIAKIRNIDIITKSIKAENIIINNQIILRNGMFSMREYPFDLEINLEPNYTSYFPTYYSGIIDSLRKDDSNFKGLKLSINGNKNPFEQLKLSEIMKLSKLNCDNLYLGNFNFNKKFIEKFARHFGTAGKRIIKWEFMKINNEDDNNDIKTDQFLNSVSEKYPVIKIFQNNKIFDMFTLNIFNWNFETDKVAKFQVNRTIFVSNIESIELESFTILKNHYINLLIDIGNDRNKFTKNIIANLKINTDNENLKQEIEEFLIYFKILSCVYYTKDFFKFNLVFEGEKNQEIIDLFKSCNMLAESTNQAND
ncbi:MAG: hypothetical protein V3575_06075 [Candidatus Absconditabacteria bacterium]